MTEHISLNENESKDRKYKDLEPQLRALISSKYPLISNLSNFIAALNEAFQFFWVGFYLVNEDHLILGPFQGSLACNKIDYGKGVCGKSWSEKAPIIVGDVSKFSGHIACDSRSASEIVIPIFNDQREVVMVLDIDSTETEYFDEVDKLHLVKLVQLLNVNAPLVK